jgi:hypothetical protein
MFSYDSSYPFLFKLSHTLYNTGWRKKAAGIYSKFFPAVSPSKKQRERVEKFRITTSEANLARLLKAETAFHSCDLSVFQLGADGK